MAVGRWPLAERSDGGWSMAVGRRKRWRMVDGRWPKEAMVAGKRSIGGRPLLWPVTYVRRLNQANEKMVDTKKPHPLKKEILFIS
jgi:hypothetical protein